MGVFGRAKLAMRESNYMGKLLTASRESRSVVVYAEDTFSYIQLKGYLNALWENHSLAYNYVTSDPEDPLLENPPPGASTWFIREQLPRLMAGLECDVFVTTMPDLGKYHVPRPKTGKVIYVFHSLNSTHTAYRSGAFDGYDQFLCTGPHHVEELRRLRRDDEPELSEVGYYKLDLISQQYRDFLEGGHSADSDLVVLAPSWGRSNLLESAGPEIIGALVSEGLRVIVRPHPQFFHSLYPEGQAVMDRLLAEYGSHEQVSFEMSIDTQDSFLRSGLMISDWSGAAYEYALGTHRPVLFIDTPQKVFNDSWEEIGLPSFERVMRQRVGSIVDPQEVGALGRMATTMLQGSEADAERLAALAAEVVYNPGASSDAGAEAIAGSL